MPTLLSRLVLPFVIVIFMPAIAFAQSAPAKPVTFQVDVVAVGNFLGQLDGFCEQPGGTYDINLRGNPLIQSCADSSGALRKGEWPVALGGLLGAQTQINAIRSSASPLVLVQGNNQVANFTFLNRQQLLDSKVNYTSSPEPLLLSKEKPTDQVQLRQARFVRFWQELAALKPAAIGLGTEDFVRSLRDPLDQSSAEAKDRGAIFQRWLYLVTSQGLPLIGSNAVIKTTGHELSVVEDDDFSLAGITKDQTTDWMTQVKVAHPRRAGIELSLWERRAAADGQDRQIDSKTTDGTAESTTLDPEHGTLLPGVRYEVRVREGSKSFTLNFKTHHALTPRQSDTSLNNFPVAVVPLDKSHSLYVLSLVDPAVKKVIGAEAWKWERKNCDAATAAKGGCNWDLHLCPDQVCEIDFMKPEDAVRAAIVRAFPEPKPGEKPDPAPRKPIIVLLSSLTDAQNQELLEKFPEIRMIVLDPDSYMLGRASRDLSTEDKGLDRRLAARIDDKQEYSGDRGLFATYNGDRPAATLLAARPEWIGESVARFTAALTYSTAPEWEIEKESITVTPIPGAALQWSATPCAPPAPGAPPPPTRSRPQECTEFFVTWPDARTRISYGPFPSYEVCEAPKPLATDADLADRCTMIASLKDEAEFATFAGDTLRRATGAELAVVPRLLIDPDAQAWLQTLIDKQHTRILTRFILERAIFRSFRIVRATVGGDKLLDTLSRALKSVHYIESCIVGLTVGCTDQVDPKAADITRVNARVIDSRSFYTVAMPEGLAEELGVPHSEGEQHTTDAVSAINQRLTTYDGGWYVPERDNALSTRIAKRADRKPQMSFLIAAFEFGLEDVNVDSALNDGNTLESLDVEFRSADTEHNVTGKLDGDWSVIDLQRVAIRAVSQINYKSKEIQPETGNEKTYPTNNWLYGGRVDWKGTLGGRETRTYGGFFMDREFAAPREFKSARIQNAAATSTITTTAKARTEYRRKPIEYGYWAGGFDYLNIKKPAWFFVDIKRLTAEYAYGWLYHVPRGARIDGVVQEHFDDTIKSPTDLLNAYFAQNQATFNTSAVLEAIPDTRRNQRRIQLEAGVERSHSIGAHEFKGTAEVRYRRFPTTDDTRPNSLKSYWRTKFDVTYTLASRIEVGPSFEWHQAEIQVPAAGQGPFTYRKWEIKVKVPFVVRAGWGWLLR